MGKLALAFKVEELGLPEFFSGIFTQKDYENSQVDKTDTPRSIFKNPTYLLQRPDCETDTTHVQLIPYTCLRAFKDGKKYIYAYQRAKMSGEQRLADKWSIGLGGHVEELPGGAKSLMDVLAESCARELEEEIGFIIDPNLTHTLISSSIFIRLQDTETDKVHLGLAHCVDITVDAGGELPDLKSCEDRVIANEGWVLYEELVDMVKDDKFELWSSLLIEDGRV